MLHGVAFSGPKLPLAVPGKLHEESLMGCTRRSGKRVAVGFEKNKKGGGKGRGKAQESESYDNSMRLSRTRYPDLMACKPIERDGMHQGHLVDELGLGCSLSPKSMLGGNESPLQFSPNDDGQSVV